MRVAAIMAIRNERPYLGNCLSHLIANGIDYYIIDNESDDETQQLLRAKPFSRHLIGREEFPYRGAFDWTGLMQVRERVAKSVDAEWVLFVSADEMMHSYRAGESLSDAIQRVANEGWNAINFDEFVFLPVEGDYAPDVGGFPPLKHYYFFEPYAPRLMRARRSDLEVSHIDAGGHTFAGSFALSPESMALRHYIVRNQEHALRKYSTRVFREDELAVGWHFNRHNQDLRGFVFPDAETLHRLEDVNERNLDRRSPRALHYWERPPPVR